MIKSNDITKQLGLDKPVLDADTLRALFESYEIVKDILDSTDKAATWFYVANPHLGEVPPINFFLIGRGHKVLNFVRTKQSENILENEDDTP